MANAIPRRHVRARGVHSPLPGFGLAMGITLLWLCFIVLVPLSAVIARSVSGGLGHFVDAAFSARALAAYRVTFVAAAAAAAANCVIGLLTAWALVRYDFPGKRLFGALVDLPFALPTAVAGIALTSIYADTGLLGKALQSAGLPIAYHPAGIFVALLFIGLPFVVRTLEPVIAESSKEQEEAALTLGASRLQLLRRVVFPPLVPALTTGFALAFARGAGEYGSVIFIAGNMPFHSEIAPLLIVTRLEEYDYPGAAAVATVLLAVSLLMLFSLSRLQGRSR